jgi:hypothetical protein
VSAYDSEAQAVLDDWKSTFEREIARMRNELQQKLDASRALVRV